MANHNRGPRTRSRKRRQGAAAGSRGAAAQASVSGSGAAQPSAKALPARSAGGARTATRSATRRGRGFKDPQSFGERPQAPWHPVPLSELLILVGAVGTVIGLKRGASGGGAPLLAGIAAVLIGTIEVTLREHLSGYRSHAVILALLPTIVFHSAIALIFHTPRSVNVALLLLDAGIFTVLFKLLRARFQDARRERVFAGRR